MKLRYMNGEKVYVEDYWPLGRDSGWDYKACTLQVVRHREIISALNRLFERAEETPDKLPDDLVGISGVLRCVLNCKSEWNAPIEILDAKTTKFDDPRKVKLAQRLKQAKLHQEIQVDAECCGKVKVIHGGLYKPPVYDHLTGEFRAFLEKERAETEEASGTA
ncbi:MAG: hypothetical protein WCO89_13355 [Syntrophus sp. (in: bacteria)]